MALLIVNSYVIFLIGEVVDTISRDISLLREGLIKIAIFMIIPFILEPITYYFKGLVLVEGQKQIVKDLYSKILKKDYAYHINKQTGKLITKVFNSAELIFGMSWELEWFTLENIASFLIPVVFIFTISYELGVAAIVAMVVSIPLLLYSLKLNIGARSAFKDTEYDRNTVIVDGVTNFSTVRAFGKENSEIILAESKLQTYRDAGMRYQNSWRVVDFISRLSGLLVFGAVSYFLITLFEKGRITLGEVTVIVAYLLQLTNRIISLFFSMRNIMKNLPIMEDVNEIIESRNDIKYITHPKLLSNPKGQIEFKNVTFTYDKKQQILEGLTLKIEPNQTIALVGPSGGGKSTIVNLLQRYYDTTSGEVLIDGINVKELSYDNLRQMIGLVPQEPVLFNRSILKNISYALEEKTDAETEMSIVVDAAKKAQIHDFIESTPDGYATVVGERGLKLSGGQKQRVAIARMLIKNPKIVIFDEATSMLDSESEIAIQKAFRELSKDKTTIIIAHRLSTITHCDKIFVVEKGKVVEEGTHKSLLEDDGLYARLWKVQSGGFKKERKTRVCVCQSGLFEVIL
ncbi:MAG: ABC transporter ATP-binding protein [Candidatus Dojkabacteria bacterium]